MSYRTPKDEKVGWAIVRGIISVIGVLFILFGWVLKTEVGTDPFTNENLWEAMHPASLLNIVGLILFSVVIVYLSGLWKFIFGDLVFPPHSTGPNLWALAVGTLGVILMYA